MELSSSQRKTVEHQFDSFSKRVLKNEARDILKEMKTRQKYEVLFSEMPQKMKEEFDARATTDKYSFETTKFMACGFEIEIENDLLVEALSELPVRSREIVLLAYYFGMSDTKIAKAMNMVRRTVQYQRSNSLKKLEKYMGGKNNAEE